jgi:hypothetical protein
MRSRNNKNVTRKEYATVAICYAVALLITWNYGDRIVSSILTFLVSITD